MTQNIFLYLTNIFYAFSKILNIGFSSEDEARLLDISKKFYDEIKSENIEMSLIKITYNTRRRQ